MRSRAVAAALAVILAGSFALKLRHLDHAAVKPLDEVFHAIVARNFLKHPLTPTLVDQPFLAYDRDDWLSNHIWLHKPPMAMWQIAISYTLLGVNTLALRLPSAVLSTLAAWMTYLIGCRLLDRTSALIGAALQAFNPVILMLVHGYVFSDHVDITLLFWTELSIYFLVRALPSQCESPKRREVFLILCGITQGIAFLSKSFPALIVLLIAVVGWKIFTSRGVLTIFLATIMTIAPWLAWTAIRFPHEFMHENVQILHHLNENVENWAAPWDRVVFDYWICIFHVFYAAIVAAGAYFLLRAWREKGPRLWLIIAWAAGVIVPNLLATSKPMCATLIGWPAAWLIFGYLVSRAVSGDRLAIGIWLASVLFAAGFVRGKLIPNGSEFWGQTPTEFGYVMRRYLWVVWSVLIAFGVGAALSRVRFSAGVHSVTVGVAVAATIFLGVRYCFVAWEVTAIDANSPNFVLVGEFAARLPGNAAFLVDEHTRFENKLVEFATDRTCYPATEENWPGRARELEQAGALPYLLTPTTVPLPVVFVDLQQHRTVYACTPAALRAAGGH